MVTKKGKKEYERATDEGFIWLKRNDSDNDKAPYLKGFVSLPEELVKGCDGLESICVYNEEHESYTLEVSLWKKGNGVLSGKLAAPVKLKDSVDDELDLDDEEEEEDVIPFEMEKETKAKTKRARR